MRRWACFVVVLAFLAGSVRMAGARPAVCVGPDAYYTETKLIYPVTVMTPGAVSGALYICSAADGSAQAKVGFTVEGSSLRWTSQDTQSVEAGVEQRVMAFYQNLPQAGTYYIHAILNQQGQHSVDRVYRVEVVDP